MKSPIAQAILDGKIFIYPTDTIYGLGCDATNEAAVAKIRQIKHRDEKPFSVIPPSDAWIAEHIDTTEIELTRGPVTYFLFPKNQRCVAKSVRPGEGVEGECSLGLRMSAHWFSHYIAEANVPFVSTSVNISGKPHMTSLEDLDPTIRNLVDLIIYEGPHIGAPSKKIGLTR